MSDQLSAIEEIYRRFGMGEITAVLDAVTDDVVWKSFAPKEIPWSGVYEGPEGVKRFFETIAEHHDYVAFYPVEFCELGNEVAVWGHYCICGKQGGPMQHGDWSHHIVMNGARIAEFRENYETGSLVRSITGAASATG